MKINREKSAGAIAPAAVSPASQTLVRGLDVLEQVAIAPAPLSAIARELGLSRSTVHRLATTLLERRYLRAAPRRGYALGPRLLQLGCQAQDQISLVRLARPYLEALAARTGGVATLALRDGDDALVVDRAAGRHKLLPSVRAGDRLDLRRSMAGRALLAAGPQPGEGWSGDDAAHRNGATSAVIADQSLSEPGICVIAAPVRGAGGAVRAALCLAAATAYLEGVHLHEAAGAVETAAQQVSEELGWRVATMHGGLSCADGDGSPAVGIGRNEEQELLALQSAGHPGNQAGAGIGPQAVRQAGRGATHAPAARHGEGDGDRMKGRPA